MHFSRNGVHYGAQGSFSCYRASNLSRWDAQAPELLDTLFTMGTDLLVESLPAVWSGKAEQLAVPQDDKLMTHAAKMVKQDGLLDFSQPAHTLHNKVMCSHSRDLCKVVHRIEHVRACIDGFPMRHCLKVSLTQTAAVSMQNC